MSAPTITLQPASKTVVRANTTTATFTVTVTGTSPLSYQWQVNDGGGFDPITGATNSTLTLNNIIKAWDQYQYRCVVTNDEGTATSNAAVLSVFNGPQLTTFLPTNASGVTTATLSCDYPTGEDEVVEVAVVLPDGRIQISFVTIPDNTTTTGETTSVPTINICGSSGTTGTPSAPFDGTISVNIHRLDGGTGTTLVSSGMPLPKGVLYPNTVGQFKLVVSNTEIPIFVEPLFGKHNDGSYKSVLIQFPMELTTGQPVSGQLQFGITGQRLSTKTPIIWEVEDAVILPSSPQYIIDTGVLLQTVPTCDLPQTALDTEYESVYATWSAQHYDRFSTYGPPTDWRIRNANYYDFALASYAQWIRTGNIEYWKRATWTARWFASVQKRWQPHLYQPDGLYYNYLLTGDDRSREYLRYWADYVVRNAFAPHRNYDWNFRYQEGRIQQRAMLATLYTALLEDTSRNWYSLADAYVQSWIDTQEPYYYPNTRDGIVGINYPEGFPIEGSRYYQLGTTGYGQSNFMEGLLVSALVTYLEFRNPSSEMRLAVEQFIQKQVEFLWNTQWQSQFQAFHYHTTWEWQDIPTKDRTNYAELNNLMSLGFAYMYHITGDSVWRDRTMQVFSRAWASSDGWKPWWRGLGGKIFNENYYSSWRVFYYLNSVRS
jgi:hypothetical protein